MTAETGPTRAPAWGHARHLRGRVNRLTVVHDGRCDDVTAPVLLTATGPAGGDPAADPDRALTVLPWEHDVTRADDGLPAGGAGGAVLVTVGLLETEVFVGDVFRWGAAEVQVSAPAVPDPTAVDPEVADRPGRGGRTGFHLRVLRTGRIDPAGTLDLIDVDPAGVSRAPVSLALRDGPAAAGVTAERLALLDEVLPADLTGSWGRPADLRNTPAVGT